MEESREREGWILWVSSSDEGKMVMALGKGWRLEVQCVGLSVLKMPRGRVPTFLFFFLSFLFLSLSCFTRLD